MKKFKFAAAILFAMLLSLAMVAPTAANLNGDGPVEPPEVIADMEPGSSMTVVKEVTTPPIPPVVDIFLLQDETGSMIDDIATLQALAPAIWDAIAASGSNFTMGVAGFRDFAQDQWGSLGDWVYGLNQDLTTTRANFVNGVNALTAGGGWDGPEAQLEALHYLATPAHPWIDSDGDGMMDPEDTPMGQQPTWRPTAQRVVLLATDAPCHVTGDPPPPGWPGDAGTVSPAVTAGILNAAGIIVIGLVPGGAGTIPCVDTLAAGTGGSVQDTGASGEDVMEAILAALEELTTDVWWEVTADPMLTVELTPDVYYDVSGGSICPFMETISVANEADPCQTLEAIVIFYYNEYDEEGTILGVQLIRIHVVPVPVDIDIKPGSYPNSINMKSKGVLPVAVLTTATIDAAMVDPATVMFNGVAYPLRWTMEDVDYDGDMDLLFHFRTQETGLVDGQTEACLTGDFFDGRAFEGCDSVRILHGAP